MKNLKVKVTCPECHAPHIITFMSDDQGKWNCHTCPLCGAECIEAIKHEELKYERR